MTVNLQNSASGYDSAFEEDVGLLKEKHDSLQFVRKERPKNDGLPNKAILADEASRDEGRRIRYQLTSLNAYDRHKMLINEYILYHPGSTSVLRRDTSRDKRDVDVIKENHQFLWDNSDEPDSWGRQLAKKYYDKLFKEYCICDLSRYKENKVGMRWRTQQEVVEGNGQFTCGEKNCHSSESLRTWEMNFAYVEKDQKKNALVKLRLCHNCSCRLNYRHQRKEVTKRKRSEKRKRKREGNETGEMSVNVDDSNMEETEQKPEKTEQDTEHNFWKGAQKLPDERNRDDEFADYLDDLFL